MLFLAGFPSCGSKVLSLFMSVTPASLPSLRSSSWALCQVFTCVVPWPSVLLLQRVFRVSSGATCWGFPGHPSLLCLLHPPAHPPFSLLIGSLCLLTLCLLQAVLCFFPQRHWTSCSLSLEWCLACSRHSLDAAVWINKCPPLNQIELLRGSPATRCLTAV